MAEEPKDPASEKKQWVEAEKLIQIGVTFPAAVFLGWAIGAGLDKWLRKDWIYLVGLLLGIAAGFAQLVRIAMQGTKEGGP